MVFSDQFYFSREHNYYTECYRQFFPQIEDSIRQAVERREFQASSDKRLTRGVVSRPK